MIFMKVDPFYDFGGPWGPRGGVRRGEAGGSAWPGSVAGQPGAPARAEAMRGRGWRRVAHLSWPLGRRVSAAAAWMSAATVAARLLLSLLLLSLLLLSLLLLLLLLLPSLSLTLLFLILEGMSG